MIISDIDITSAIERRISDAAVLALDAENRRARLGAHDFAWSPDAMTAHALAHARAAAARAAGRFLALLRHGIDPDVDWMTWQSAYASLLAAENHAPEDDKRFWQEIISVVVGRHRIQGVFFDSVSGAAGPRQMMQIRLRPLAWGNRRRFMVSQLSPFNAPDHRLHAVVDCNDRTLVGRFATPGAATAAVAELEGGEPVLSPYIPGWSIAHEPSPL